MHYDVIIIGAGMSGLAAGIRLAYFDKRVCVVEKHYAFGGLNSYYTLNGREYDVGLHAVTNYVPPGNRTAALPKLLRQLRLTREDFDLREQSFSEIRFPDNLLRFNNDITLLKDEVAEQFPRDADRFRRFVHELEQYDDTLLDRPYKPTRSVLRDRLTEPVLIEMLLCPVMYYGSAEPHDMDFTQFVTMFKSLFCEGLARPPGGVRTIIRALVRKFRACGGKLMMNSGVESIEVDNGRAAGVTLQDGRHLTADVILSSAGYFETMRMCADDPVPPPEDQTGEISFVETIGTLDRPPADLGHEATVVFFNDGEEFCYACPDDPVDLRSGVVCTPNNYLGHEHLAEGVFRVTWLADHRAWMGLDEATYNARKQAYHGPFLDRARSYIPDFAEHLVCTDMFTPRTIHRYTGHIHGAVYGAPRKLRDGRTRLENLFICGTDQGFLGIIGAMLSGITIANLHVLAEA